MSVHVNLKPLISLGRVIDEVVLTQWDARYRAFAGRRFSQNSRGGGDWAPLKASTLRRRRKGRGRGLVAAILVNTATLKNVLVFKFAGAGGQLREFLRGGNRFRGVRVGFGGPAKHPSGSKTIAGIANIHQAGNSKGNLPARRIIVEPDDKTMQGMASDVTRRWNHLARGGS